MISRRDMLKASGAALAGLAAVPGIWPRLHSAAQDVDEDLTQYVDPFIGTGAHGHTYPGVQVPFGMVQLSPDNGVDGWDWSSGYHWSSDRIAGFSHTHLSGTGIGDMYDILFMPTLLSGPASGDTSCLFSHESERAAPGYYSVDLLDTGITVELTATERVGMHRYFFPAPRSDAFASLVVDLGHSLNWDRPTDTMITVESPTLISGYRMSSGWAKDQRLYFAASFSRPFTSHWLEAEWAEPAGHGELKGLQVKGTFQFRSESAQSIVAKVAISAVSVEGAKRNLREELPNWNFDIVRLAAQEAWDRALARVRISTSSSEDKIVLYTALYHALLAPQLFCDYDGSYRGPDGEVHQAGFANYSVFSLWDTFRAEHPLLTLVQPERVSDFVESMMAFHRESGLLPVWSLAGNETNTMIGYHSVPVILDAWLKGLTEVDPRLALEAMKESANQDAHGLRYYRMPTPVSLQEARKTDAESEMRRVASIDARQLRTFGTLINGYAESVAGETITYQSPYRDARSALLVRTENGLDTVTWNTAPVPEGVGEQMMSFVWLVGLDASADGRVFDLLVNGDRWFSFRTPLETDTSFRIRGRDDAALSFRATHTDQFNDLFGFMFLTLPANLVQPGEALQLSVRGEAAGTRDWYMTFQYALSSKLSVQNVYGLIADFDLVRQLVRIDLEHLTSPTDATVQIDDRRPEKIKLQFGYNSLLVTAPIVDIDKPTVVTLNYSDGSTVQTEFQLRPVQPFKYMPADLERESVSKTLEYAYDDWCIAQLADELNEEDDVNTFSERATFYRNVYDPSTGFMRGRLADGSWKEPFSPRFTSHRQDDYTEGNAWQYSWFVPHDVRGLIELMGGREAFVAKLDELFSQSSILEGSAPPDVSGLIGQYAHGNEPSHHIAYLYAYAGAPWKTQERVRQIIDSLYNATPEGLSGNEDCGQLSAWYIFSAIGLYPVNPADGTYVIGTPRFERVTIQLEGGRQFTVEAPGVSETNMYIQTARLNGRPLDRCYITHDEIANGGTLVFIMGATPNRSWAASEAAAPPSMTR